MAQQTIDIKIRVDKQGNASLSSMQKGFETIKINAKQASQAAKQLGVDINKIQSSGSVKVAANDFNKLGAAIGGASAASGGATASVLEFGRVISDAPYGIRGVANNLQQLASNFAFMTKQAGGAGAAFKAIGSALMGPLGILIAFQAVIAALDYFSNRVGKTKDTLGELESQGITTNVTKLHMLREAVNDSSIALEDQIASINKAATEFDELGGFIEGGTIKLDAFNSKIDEMIEGMREVAFAKAILKETESVMQDFVKTVTKGAGPDIKDQLAALFNPFASADMVAAGGFANSVEEFAEQYDKLFNMLKGKQADGEGILLEHLFGAKDKSGSRGRRQAALREQALDLEKFMIQQMNTAVKLSTQNESELLDIKQQGERDDLRLKRDSFIERQELRLKNFLSVKRTQAEIKQANEAFNASKLQAEEEYQEAVGTLEVKHITQRHRFRLELEQKFAQEIIDQKLRAAQADVKAFSSRKGGAKAGMLNKPASSVGAESIDAQNEMQRALMEQEKEAFEARTAMKVENLLNQGYSELEAEQMVAGDRHAFQQSQAMQELDLERNKLEAKKNMNMEYASWVQGLGSIFSSIAKDNEALAKVGLVLEKGAAIAGVIIQTQRANAEIGATMLAEQGAYNAAAAATALVAPPISAGFKTAAITAGVMGKKRILKNNIGAGISIAKIAATTLQSRGGSGGGASGAAGGGAPSREFDFNLVGSTGVNQLAEGVANQFNQQPVQAYVVSSQMTSQQQLDHTIQTQASIGD